MQKSANVVVLFKPQANTKYSSIQINIFCLFCLCAFFLQIQQMLRFTTLHAKIMVLCWEISFYQWSDCVERGSRLYKCKLCTNLKMVIIDSNVCYRLHVEVCRGSAKQSLDPSWHHLGKQTTGKIEPSMMPSFDYSSRSTTELFPFFSFCLGEIRSWLLKRLLPKNHHAVCQIYCSVCV